MNVARLWNRIVGDNNSSTVRTMWMSGDHLILFIVQDGQRAALIVHSLRLES